MKTLPIKPHLIALALAAAFPMHAALAQSAEAPAAEAKKDTTTLNTVIVTGSRRAENIRDVPMSISAIKGEELDAYNASGQDVRALSGRVPSLNIESDFGRTFPRFYIRGLGNTDFDLNASQPVGLVYDDVVQESPMLKGFPVFDVEQVEVLRGPQGTLFGRNSPAGVMKFDSVKPGKRFEGYVNTGFGKNSAFNLEAAVNAPLSEDWAMRAAVLFQRASDRVHNPLAGATSDLEGYNDKAARVQASYKNGGFNALFNLHGRDYAGSATTFRANIIKRGTNDLVDGFDASVYPTDGYNEQTLKSKGASARLRWELNGMTLHSITAYDTAKFYSRGDVDGGFGCRLCGIPDGPKFSGQPSVIPFDAQTADGLPELKQTTQEFRLQSNTSEALQWIGGLYFFKEKMQVDSFNFDSFSAGDPQNGYAYQHQDSTSWAAFGSLNYAVTSDLKIRGGLRYTDDKKDFDAARTQTPFGNPNAGPFTANPRSTNWSWDLSANYTLNKDTSLFTRVATGYRAPSIQGRVLFGDSISVANSEKALSFEAGFKTDLLNKTARISGTVFSYKVDDLQLTAGSGSVNQNQLVNAKKATGQGFELDAQAIIARDWRTTLGLSYNDTEIKDDKLFVSPCGNKNWTDLTPNTGCTVQNKPSPDAKGGVLIGGNPLPRAPKWVGNWTLRYSTELAGGDVYVLTDWAYKAEYNMFLYKAAEYRAKSLLEGGLRVGYGWNNSKYEVSAYVRNMTNEQQVVAAIDFNNLTGIINEPRSYGLQFKASF
ncbi:TonB-dependent receptor [Roseateles oligotrophus]|uniref:TonB-dependent receptor n=1 Tax=Roseateles oligotrophus TaxID=1769250 RepID=A0ABT2YCC9_9BURK|nr:TonB-dependent receptor [Roseateles oligotrophus]MCV2367701.1 TonB-dependent receptor [Roseateles oligotrophus]